MNRYVELLAGAGSMDAAKAAMSAGCDAIYLGLKDYGARKMAENFTFPQLEEVASLAHKMGKKVYLTLNTLIKDNEVPAFINAVRTARECGCDAFIMQDLGMIALMSKIFPAIEIHASTQANAHNVNSISKLHELKVKRIILSRECEIEEIRRICAESKPEIETFVAGALCSAVSGVCYMSSFATNRSGNRGLCSQMCRLKYSAIGRPDKYYLSTRDISMVPLLGELYDAGVKSFKIEGRGRSASYIYNVTSALREATDLVMARNLTPDEALRINEKMSRTYNRTYCTGYLKGRATCDVIYSERNQNYGLLASRDIVDFWADTLTMKIKMCAAIGANDLLDLESPEGERALIKIEAIFDRDKKHIFKAEKGDSVFIKFKFLTLEKDAKNPKDRSGFVISRVYLVHSEEASSIKKLKILQDKDAPKAEGHLKQISINVDIYGRTMKTEIWFHGKKFEYPTEAIETQKAEKHSLSTETLKNTFAAYDKAKFSCPDEKFKAKFHVDGIFIPLSCLKKYGKAVFERFHADFEKFAEDEKQFIASNTHSRHLLGLNETEGAKPHPIKIAPEKMEMELLLFSDELINVELAPHFNEAAASLNYFMRQGGTEAIVKYAKWCVEKELEAAIELPSTLFQNEIPVFENLVTAAAESGVAKFIVNNLSQFEVMRRIAKKTHKKFFLSAGSSMNVINLHTCCYLINQGADEICLSFELNHNDIINFLKTAAEKAPEVIQKLRIRAFGNIAVASFAYDFFRQNMNYFKADHNEAPAGTPFRMAALVFKNGAHYITAINPSKTVAYSSGLLNMTSYLNEYAAFGVEKFAFSLFNYSKHFDADLADTVSFVRNYRQDPLTSPLSGHGIKKDRLLE